MNEKNPEVDFMVRLHEAFRYIAKKRNLKGWHRISFWATTTALDSLSVRYPYKPQGRFMNIQKADYIMGVRRL
jgi:hypothetical protein